MYKVDSVKKTYDVINFGVNNPKYNKALNEKINNKTKDSIAIGLNKTCSFRGDMEVKTNSGYKPIEKLVIGERVLSRNELTGLVTYQKIEAHYSNPYDFTVYIKVEGKNGVSQTIVSNKVHPFFAQLPKGETALSSEGHHYHDKIHHAQWVDAQNLKVGYKLLSEKNQWKTIKGVTIKPEKLTAYNLTVSNDHTYFIRGHNSDSEGVWVHNDCWNNLPADAVRTGKTTPDGRALYTFKIGMVNKLPLIKEKMGIIMIRRFIHQRD